MMDADNKDGANMTQQSVLNAFDFSAIEEMDPSLGKYYKNTSLKSLLIKYAQNKTNLLNLIVC